MKPFGDRRQLLRSVCSFDLIQDLLSYSNTGSHIQISLARLREPNCDLIQRSEFTPLERPPPHPQLDLVAEFPPPYEESSIPVPERRLAFSSRILSDFADQWRHILRSSYAESTFRRLAKAVICIATNDFRVDELFTRQHVNSMGYYVSVRGIPSWQPYKRCLFSIAGITVVLHQDLQTALKIAQNAAKENSKVTNPYNRIEQRTYLLLSVRHMLVCFVDSTGTLSYTAPTIFMDGFTLPSTSAVKLLLQALLPTRPPLHTPIHDLPLEIQDGILKYTSEGSVEAARLGCVLGLGSPVTWIRTIDKPRRGGLIELFMSPSHRSEATAIESKLYFGDVFSGVSYRQPRALI